MRFYQFDADEIVDRANLTPPRSEMRLGASASEFYPVEVKQPIMSSCCEYPGSG